ncbi:nidogen-like domain-containing protein [Nodularia chucula]|uniref:nidogen-like domain-containing protein n=1 Tax=Nodularia chucula TaxID=3093667 RepID=UPI0039C5B348
MNTCTKAKYKFKLSKTLGLAVMATVLSLTSLQAAFAAAVRPGLFGANTVPRNDDSFTSLVDLGFTANFFGLEFNQTYVNNNGNITFDQALGTYTPFDLTSTGRQIIAPFFADVDTRNSASNRVTYGTGIVDGFNAFGVNYIDVGYFPSAADRLNSFQMVLIDRSDTGAGNFDIEFNYDQIQWETGGASGGTGGLGGSSARVGFSNGTGNPGSFFELPGSAINGAFLDGGPNALIADRLNSDVDGRYIFTAREGEIIVDVPPPVDPPIDPPVDPPVDSPTSVPEPTTILGLLAFGAFGATSALKRKQQYKAAAKA